MECHRFCWRLGTRTGRDFSGFERRLFGRKPEWQKHWRGRICRTILLWEQKNTRRGWQRHFTAYYCERKTNVKRRRSTRRCRRHLPTSIRTSGSPPTPRVSLAGLCTLFPHGTGHNLHLPALLHTLHQLLTQLNTHHDHRHADHAEDDADDCAVGEAPLMSTPMLII